MPLPRFIDPGQPDTKFPSPDFEAMERQRTAIYWRDYRMNFIRDFILASARSGRVYGPAVLMDAQDALTAILDSEGMPHSPVKSDG